FAGAGDGARVHTRWESEGFRGCASIGGVAPPGQDAAVFGDISAFDAGARSMGVMARSRSGDLMVKWWTAGEWRPFAAIHGIAEIDPLDPVQQLMRPLAGPPAACGGGSARADVFLRGPRARLFDASWDGERRWQP